MTRRVRKVQGQRGAVALEFALVFPIFLGTLGLIFSVGLGMWSRYQLLNFATAAARSCAFRVPIVTGNMDGCARAFIAILQSQPGGSPPCNNMQVSTQLLPVGANAMQLFEVTLTCKGAWMPLVNAISGVSSGGTAFDIIAKSGMPFLPPQAP